MGISILIVDDDKLLVEKLEETVNWSGIGIDMVFTANNIRQAQKLLEEYPIEMLLCDIDMPQGNGLELLEWIRYKKLDIECTFLSSYANFAYAQMALKLSSREYPVSYTHLLFQYFLCVFSLFFQNNPSCDQIQLRFGPGEIQEFAAIQQRRARRADMNFFCTALI